MKYYPGFNLYLGNCSNKSNNFLLGKSREIGAENNIRKRVSLLAGYKQFIHSYTGNNFDVLLPDHIGEHICTWGWFRYWRNRMPNLNIAL